ncbi:MAG: peptidylprolyl isomerase [Candidatus Magasanikbacteria bacterium]
MDSQNSDEQKVGKSSKNLRLFLFGLGGILLTAIVIIVGISLYRVYHLAATDGFTVGVARVLRLPAFKINGRGVAYSEFVEDLKAIHVMRDFEKQSGGEGATLTEEQMTDQVLWRLANNVLINEAALQNNITAEEKDVEEIKSQVLQQFETTAAAEKELQARYGWTMDVYERKVIKPYILQNKLSEQFETNETMRIDIRNQAQAVLDAIKNGADFVTQAKIYGSDSTKDSGGDLGWFGRGEMVPQFEEAVFALKKGELDPELVETSYGYHIIKLDDTKTEQVKDEQGKTIEEQKVRASHILFRFPDLTQYLDKAVTKAELHLYLNIHNPFVEFKKQLETSTN